MPLSYRQEVLADDPEAYFRLQEAVGASSVASEVNGHTATVTYDGSNTFPRFEEPSAIPADTSAEFASDQVGYIVAPASDTLLGGSPLTWTVEAWLYHALGATPQCAISDYDSADTTNFSMFMGILANNKARWLLRQSNVSYDCQSTSDLASSNPVEDPLNWRHVVGVVDLSSGVAANRTSKLYLNGVLEATVTNVPQVDFVPPSREIYLGVQWNNGGAPLAPWGGFIDEVAIYSTALSAARVLAHYNARGVVETGPEGWGTLI